MVCSSDIYNVHDYLKVFLIVSTTSPPSDRRIVFPSACAGLPRVYAGLRCVVAAVYRAITSSAHEVSITIQASVLLSTCGEGAL